MRKDKKLLNETTVRRFMELAKLSPLSVPFLERQKLQEERECSLKKEEVEMEKEVEVEAPMPETETEEPIQEPESKEQMVTKLVDAIADAIESATGVEVEVESDEEPAVPAEGMDAPKEEPVDTEEEMVQEEKELVPLKPEKMKGKDMEMKEGETGSAPGTQEFKPAPKVKDSIIEEITKRVLQKIIKESKKKK